MTTPIAVLVTQIPIAIACLWVAWELRRLRRAVERVLEEERDPGTSGSRE